MTEIVGKNVLFALNIVQPRRELFNLVAPLQNTLCFEVVEGEIFVINEDMYVCTQKHISKLCKSSCNGEEFLFHASIFLCFI
jgi:hypothetical protein